MTRKTISFSRSSTVFYFDAAFTLLKKELSPKNAVIITDENIFSAHTAKFKGWNTIVLKAGEEYKVQATVDSVINQLIGLEADRTTTLVGVGGGVITDITGYVASVFLRGVPFGFVPTSLLAMVDASIGGKNGIDVGVYKNMVGTINQPKFILYDLGFLKTLPDAEWRQGFAEIIKHAAIKDAGMFGELSKSDLAKYQSSKPVLEKMVQRNVLIKARLVQKDEFEKNQRRLLNFGHTLAHALEKQYTLMHGEAVAIGMTFAAKLSEKFSGFRRTAQLTGLIEKYGLPVSANYQANKVFEVLSRDKKKEGDIIHFVLLQKIGKATIQKIPLHQINELL